MKGAQKVHGSHLTPSGILGGGLSGRRATDGPDGLGARDARSSVRGVNGNLTCESAARDSTLLLRYEDE